MSTLKRMALLFTVVALVVSSFSCKDDEDDDEDEDEDSSVANWVVNS